MDRDIAGLMLVLGAFSLTGVVIAFYIARRLNRFLNFRTLLILNVVMADLVSGMVHLADVEGPSRGYFDILSTPGAPSATPAVFGGILALGGVCAACLRKLPSAGVARQRPRDPTVAQWLLPSERRFLLVAVLLMVPLTYGATLKVKSFAASEASTRIIGLDSGLARYSYISNWLVWTISFAAIWFVGTRFGRQRPLILLVTGISILLITMSLSWTGGRSIVVVMCLPLILVLLPFLHGLKTMTILVATSAAGFYIASITQARATGQSYDLSSLSSWVDWQWGRFSMLGFSSDYVSTHGYLWGETFVAGLLSTVFGALRLAGIDVPVLSLATSTQISGESLGGSRSATHIVPGFSAELYLNFGLVGIIVGYYVLGRITNWVDCKFRDTPSAIGQLVYAYVGTLLVFRTVVSDSGSFWAYLLFSGTPLLVAATFSFWARGPGSMHSLLRAQNSPRMNGAAQSPSVCGRSARVNRNGLGSSALEEGGPTLR